MPFVVDTDVVVVVAVVVAAAAVVVAVVVVVAVDEGRVVVGLSLVGCPTLGVVVAVAVAVLGLPSVLSLQLITGQLIICNNVWGGGAVVSAADSVLIIVKLVVRI